MGCQLWDGVGMLVIKFHSAVHFLGMSGRACFQPCHRPQAVMMRPPQGMFPIDASIGNQLQFEAFLEKQWLRSALRETSKRNQLRFDAFLAFQISAKSLQLLPMESGRLRQKMVAASSGGNRFVSWFPPRLAGTSFFL